MPPQGDNTAKAQAQGKSFPDDSPIISASPLSPVVVQVDDKIYDAKTLAKAHAGGELFVKVFAGRDATEAFLSYHRKRFPHDRMKSLCLGSAQPMKTYKDEDYLELCKLVEEVLPRSKAFAPWHYWLKLAVLLGLAFGLEFFIHATKSYRWYLTGPLGLIFAWVGMNVQHDANHGSLSPVAAINRLFGLTQNWIGGSALDWIHQHDVQHHIYPNSVTTDPDIVGNDFLRLNPLKPRHRYQLGQHLYVFLLFALFGMSYIISSVGHIVNGFHYTRMSALVTKNRLFEEATMAFFVLRWIVFPLYQVPALSTLLNILPLFVVGGYYLAFFFIISHNFENAYFYRDDKDEAVKVALHLLAVLSPSFPGNEMCVSSCSYRSPSFASRCARQRMWVAPGWPSSTEDSTTRSSTTSFPASSTRTTPPSLPLCAPIARRRAFPMCTSPLSARMLLLVCATFISLARSSSPRIIIPASSSLPLLDYLFLFKS